MMKAMLEFDLPEEQKSLDDAVHGGEWRAALEAIAWQVLCWEQGKPDFGAYPGHELEEPVTEIRPVLELINEELKRRGLDLE